MGHLYIATDILSLKKVALEKDQLPTKENIFGPTYITDFIDLIP